MKTCDALFIWLTGMSGSGKTTLSRAVEQMLTDIDLKVLVIDGDDVRKKYRKKLGFSRDDVMKNNLGIANICVEYKNLFDVVIVSVISPYEEARVAVRTKLGANFRLIYIKTDLESLKERDPKGLYSSADNGLITDLVGYSDSNPYEVPKKSDFSINTGGGSFIEQSKTEMYQFIIDSLSKTKKRK